MLIVPYDISVLKGLYMNNTPKKAVFPISGDKDRICTSLLPPPFC